MALQEFFQIVGHFKDELERRMQLQDNEGRLACCRTRVQRGPGLQDLNLSISDLQAGPFLFATSTPTIPDLRPVHRRCGPGHLWRCPARDSQGEEGLVGYCCGAEGIQVDES